MVEIGITRKPSTKEFRVFWKENGRDVEAKAYYTDFLTDAVETLYDIESRNEKAGIPAKVSTSKLTSKLVRSYNESFGGAVG